MILGIEDRPKRSTSSQTVDFSRLCAPHAFVLELQWQVNMTLGLIPSTRAAPSLLPLFYHLNVQFCSIVVFMTTQ
nr:hypothetical protein CFP56_05982 [Quercus suber]